MFWSTWDEFYLYTCPGHRAIRNPSCSQTYFEYRRNRFENQLTAEREATLRYKGENGIMKKKFTVLTKDIEDQKVSLPLQKLGRLLEQGTTCISARSPFSGR